jgi:hypothetical protein
MHRLLGGSASSLDFPALHPSIASFFAQVNINRKYSKTSSTNQASLTLSSAVRVFITRYLPALPALFSRPGD